MVEKAGGLKGARYAPTASGGKPLTPPAFSTARSAMPFMPACCISELKRRLIMNFALSTAPCSMLESDVDLLTPFLNSRLAWFFWKSLTPEIRGGFIRFKAQYVSLLPILTSGGDPLPVVRLGTKCTEDAGRRHEIQSEVRHRILDLAPPELRKLTGKLENFHKLEFAAFREEVKKAFHADIPVKERGDWEVYIAEKGAEVRRLTSEIEAAEREIDAIVYKLFHLTADEIALLEASLAGQY